MQESAAPSRISFGIFRSRRAILPVFAQKRNVKAIASGRAIV